jgi:hypothetical protein
VPGYIAGHFCMNDDRIQVGQRSAAMRANSSSAACGSSMISPAITSGVGRGSSPKRKSLWSPKAQVTQIEARFCDAPP